jgi:hypothetical protein
MIPSTRFRKDSWSIEEEAILRRLLLEGCVVQDLSAQFDRTPAAIGNMARRMGLSQYTQPNGTRRWYDPLCPPEGVVVRSKPTSASDDAWAARDKPRFEADYLARIWTEAMAAVRPPFYQPTMRLGEKQ